MSEEEYKDFDLSEVRPDENLKYKPDSGHGETNRKFMEY